LNALLPGSPVVIDLVGETLNCVRETSRGTIWSLDKEAEHRSASEADRKRLDQVLALLSSELSGLMDQAVRLEQSPEQAQAALDQTLATDGRVQESVRRLTDLACRFERLEAWNRLLLQQQGYAAETLTELLPLLRRLVGLADFVAELGAAHEEPAEFQTVLSLVRTLASAFARGDLVEAEHAVGTLLSQRPGSAAAQVAAAAVQAAGHHTGAARATLNLALQLRPHDRELADLQRGVTRVCLGEAGALANTRSRARVGDVLDGWHLEAVLEQGGGQVFRARKGVGVAALEVIPPALVLDASLVERFQQEVRTLTRLPRHRNLAEVCGFGYDQAQGCWFVITELIEGCSLEEHLANSGPLAPVRARELFLELADGLALAHQQGVVYRDVKPANIILRPDGTPVLVGSGLAVRSGRSGFSRPGSSPEFQAGFTAPEQLRHQTFDRRSDVYSLAAVLSYALTYDRPHARQPGDFVAQDIPAPFRALLNCALHDNPAERHRDAAEFRDALRRIELVVAEGVHPQVEIRLWGSWLSRLASDPEGTGWVPRSDTPARVTLEPGHIYQLRVHPEARDEDLSGLSGLKHLTAFAELSLRDCREVSDAGLSHLRGLLHLRDLDLCRCNRITGAGLANLGASTSLAGIELAGCEQLTDAAMLHLTTLPELRRLGLRDCERLTDLALAELRNIVPRLTALALPPGVTDAGLRTLALRGLPALQRLELTGCRRITSAGLTNLRGLSRLDQLELGECEQINDRGLESFLANLAHLQVLGLPPSLTDVGLQVLRRRFDLRQLSLNGCRQVLGPGLVHVSHLLGLTVLSLASCTELRDEGLRHVSGLTQLHKLELTRCLHLTDAGLAHLRALVGLRVLDLGWCGQLTDDGLREISGLSNLQELSLAHCEHLTDNALACLRGMPRLESLRLEGCPRMTDAGLASLRKSGLVRLDLRSCTGITDRGVTAFRVARPGCVVER
jgi:hypothetical protein